MPRSSDSEVLAGDVYKQWKRRVKVAEESVQVFTPYLDRLLDSLLGNAVIDADAISVVTDLSPSSGAFDYLGQLRGVRRVLLRGIEVRSLPRLHAKVLLCDGRLATVGSQNFTSYARGSRETTVVVPQDVAETDFARTLAEWHRMATPVDLEFVEQLIEGLEEEAKAVTSAQQVLVAAFTERWQELLVGIETERQERAAAAAAKSFSSRLSGVVRATRERYARETVWARVVLTNEWDGFETFRADRGSTFTRWRVRDEQGRSSMLTLERTKMHPMILGPSGRMGFGRVGDQQITYVRDAVSWNRPHVVSGRPFHVTVQFPNDGLEFANIEMSLTVAGQNSRASLELRVQFDGSEAELVDGRVEEANTAWGGVQAAGSQPAVLESLAEDLDDPETLGDLLAGALAPFKYKTLGIANTNAADFFPYGWARVNVIDFRGRAVLAVTPQ